MCKTRIQARLRIGGDGCRRSRRGEMNNVVDLVAGAANVNVKLSRSLEAVRRDDDDGEV